MFCVILVFDIEFDECKQSSEGTFADFPNAPPHKIDLIEGVVATNFPQQLSQTFNGVGIFAYTYHNINNYLKKNPFRLGQKSNCLTHSWTQIGKGSTNHHFLGGI